MGGPALHGRAERGPAPPRGSPAFQAATELRPAPEATRELRRGFHGFLGLITRETCSMPCVMVSMDLLATISSCSTWIKSMVLALALRRRAPERNSSWSATPSSSLSRSKSIHASSSSMSSCVNILLTSGFVIIASNSPLSITPSPEVSPTSKMRRSVAATLSFCLIFSTAARSASTCARAMVCLKKRADTILVTAKLMRTV
mmetsp:Transcript_96711/g.301156  ORF Transcript_96711/g.301156 Transcript_96711/m.301156 type:complete len:202 (+) Transcript_96711:64-669(+)